MSINCLQFSFSFHMHMDSDTLSKSFKTFKTVPVVGDSFKEAMEPNLGYVFENVFVIHRSDYKKDMIDEINPNFVILEFVERYSDQILHFKLY